MGTEQTLKEVFYWSVESLLSDIILHYSNSMYLIDYEKQRIEKAISIATKEEKKVLKGQLSYLKSMHKPNSRNQTFLMLWSALEEVLYLTLRTGYKSKISEVRQSSGIGRYNPLLCAAGIDLASYAPWRFIKSSQDIRNCLLHANGRIDLVKESSKGKLLQCLENNKKLYGNVNSRVQVNELFINEFNSNAKLLLKDLVNSPCWDET